MPVPDLPTELWEAIFAVDEPAPARFHFAIDSSGTDYGPEGFLFDEKGFLGFCSPDGDKVVLSCQALDHNWLEKTQDVDDFDHLDPDPGEPGPGQVFSNQLGTGDLFGWEECVDSDSESEPRGELVTIGRCRSKVYLPRIRAIARRFAASGTPFETSLELFSGVVVKSYNTYNKTTIYQF